MAGIENFVCASEKCTLCMACLNACPLNAISADIDENGYEQIVVDSSRCVNCGICKKVCQKRVFVQRNTPVITYAAQAKDKKALEKSASGGAFQMLAQIVLEKGGVCYGCEFGKDEYGYRARHVRIDSHEQLPRILNSKYVPSIVGKAFQQAKQDLKLGRLVLFSGTPCEIQGLKAFLENDYDNLLTVDLICHGVTSNSLFNNYIANIEQRDGVKIVDYLFRDKKVSWGTNFSYSFYKSADKKCLVQTRHCPREESSYMAHYLRRDIFRENCYVCDCSNTKRVSDFTLGDYWEIEREHPEFVTRCTPRIVLRQGVSCILVNTEKGREYVKELNDRMIMHEVTLDSVTAHNSNLREPSNRGRRREWFLETYRSGGYAPIEDAYRTKVGKKMLLYRIKNGLKSYMPDFVRIWIYQSPILRRIVFHQ